MALRFRRVLTSLPATLHRTISAPPTTPSPVPLPGPALSTLRSPNPVGRSPLRFFSEGGRQFKLYKEGDEITEDTVLFEGCDFNHWLITVDFPKDPKPSPEEMVATYERICAQGLNISIEEAKKRMYACSTTTYQGFQAIMTEAESEKFTNVPGVVFVLPDSYIDPVNKEYGGDKYENGVITPRPPPYVPQRRDRRPRFDQPRNPRYDQPRTLQNYPREYQSPQYNQQMPMQGNPNNFGPPQNFPRQDPSSFGPQNFPRQDPNNFGPPQNFPRQDPNNFGPPQNFPRQDPNNFGPPQNFPRQDPNNFGPPQNFPRQDPGFPERRDHGPLHNVPTQQNFIPPVQERDMPTNNRNFAPRGWDNNQVNGGGPAPPFQSNSNHQPPDQRGFPRGGNQQHNGCQEQAFARDSRNYVPPGGSDCQDDYGQAYPKEGFSQMEQKENTQPGVRRV